MSTDFCHRKEEYLSLRKEIETSLSELSILEKNSLLAIAAIYSWLASHNNLDPFFKTVATAAPVFISLFGALRAYSVNRHLGIISRYIKCIEDITCPGDSKIKGWEHFFEKEGGGNQTKVRIGFWIFLVLATAVVWAVNHCKS